MKIFRGLFFGGLCGVLFFSFSVFTGCSSTQEIQRQQYAQLRTKRTFEAEFPQVWKAIEEVFRQYKVEERDPEEVSDSELKKLNERSLQTAWIYTRSKDKYVEYEINGFPRKTYLQTRLRYELTAKRVMGGTHVEVRVDEEVEKLDDQGSPAGYERMDSEDVDSSRANEILDSIQNTLRRVGP